MSKMRNNIFIFFKPRFKKGYKNTDVQLLNAKRNEEKFKLTSDFE